MLTSLSWSTHIHDVIKKCNSYLYLLSRIKVYLSVNNRKLFYNAYILPHFDVVSYGGNCSRFLEERLVRLQKRAARIILDFDFSLPFFVLFSKLRWMPFPERVLYQKAI